MKRAQADVDRMKATALAVMQRFDVKELKATPGGGLRRQKNGGVDPVEVTEIGIVPIEYRRVTVTMTNEAWSSLVIRAGADAVETLRSDLSPDTERIREALKQRVVCPECKGEAVTPGNCRCERCDGSGTVPATVPGARLLPKGEHVRVI
jgi:hypothetical protein